MTSIMAIGTVTAILQQNLYFFGILVKTVTAILPKNFAFFVILVKLKGGQLECGQKTYWGENFFTN